MIVQCGECKTRFRMAAEKAKPTGTKVRCSRCKHIFTVFPPTPPHSSILETTSNETASQASESVEKQSLPSESGMAETGQMSAEDEQGSFSPNHSPGAAATSSNKTADWLGSDRPDEKTAKSINGMEDLPAAEFSHTGSNAPDEEGLDLEKPSSEKVGSSSLSLMEQDKTGLPQPSQQAPSEVEAEFGEGSLDSDQAETSEEFVPAGGKEYLLASDQTSDEKFLAAEDSELPEEPVEAFDNPDQFGFDEGSKDTETDTFDLEGDSQAQDFTFEEEDFDATSPENTDWSESTTDEDVSFDFDEPEFDSSSHPSFSNKDGGLQFGEIDFSDEPETPKKVSVDTEPDLSEAASSDEDDLSPSIAPSPDFDRTINDERQDTGQSPLPQLETKRKSSTSRLLFLLFLLLATLLVASGYFYMQSGVTSLKQLVSQFPFLEPYVMQSEQGVAKPRIGINIQSSKYIKNRHAGQLLVIQGEAVNNHPSARSAITIKGILLDKQDNILLQQTVFCGNFINEEKLRNMPFANIEETMNNQFGDSLSNMNVAPGAKIPFTIVFRNLPGEIANINVEVVDSKPGQ